MTKKKGKAQDAIRVKVPSLVPDLDSVFPNKVSADRGRAILLLLHFVRMRMLKNPNFAPGINRTTGYCPIESKALIQIVTTSYKRILGILYAAQVIQVKKDTVTGRESYDVVNKWTKLYRLNPILLAEVSSSCYRTEFITHPDVIRAVRRYFNQMYERQLKQVEAKGQHYAQIARYADQFDIDMTRLQEDINSGAHVNSDELEEYALLIKEGLFKWVTHDSYGKHLHTSLGNSPKALRNYMVLKDAPETPLVMVDVKGSQPYCLSVLFYKTDLLSLIPEFEPVKHILIASRDLSDVRIFYEDCAAGVFYERCFQLFGSGNSSNKLEDDERQLLKDKIFRYIFYGHPGNFYKDKKIREERWETETRFKLFYSGVHNMLFRLKRIKKDDLPFLRDHYRSRNKRAKIFTAPNSMAQRLESKLLLDMVAATMFSLNMPVFVIHDAFILEKAHLEVLLQVFEQVFTVQLGIKPPQLHVTMLSTRTQ